MSFFQPRSGVVDPAEPRFHGHERSVCEWDESHDIAASVYRGLLPLHFGNVLAKEPGELADWPDTVDLNVPYDLALPKSSRRPFCVFYDRMRML